MFSFFFAPLSASLILFMCMHKARDKRITGPDLAALDYGSCWKIHFKKEQRVAR